MFKLSHSKRPDLHRPRTADGEMKIGDVASGEARPELALPAVAPQKETRGGRAAQQRAKHNDSHSALGKDTVPSRGARRAKDAAASAGTPHQSSNPRVGQNKARNLSSSSRLCATLAERRAHGTGGSQNVVSFNSLGRFSVGLCEPVLQFCLFHPALRPPANVGKTSI